MGMPRKLSKSLAAVNMLMPMWINSAARMPMIARIVRAGGPKRFSRNSGRVVIRVRR